MRADSDKLHPQGLASVGTTSHVSPAPDFTQWYEQHFAFVWRCVRRLGVPEAQLDDAVQDTFLVVHRKLPDYRPDHSPRTWLFSIARRVASDHRRRLRRKGGLSALPAELAAPDQEGPEHGAGRRQASEIIQRFLRQLDEHQAAVFILVELEQMTAPEVARALSIDTTAVYSRVRASRKALRQYVAEHHPDHHPDRSTSPPQRGGTQ